MTPRRRRHYKVQQLPEELRQLVDRMLSEGVPYEEIERIVREAGGDVSKSGLHRYHASIQQVTERIVRAREQVQALVEAVRDHPDTDLAHAASSIMMQGLLERVARAEEDFEKMDLVDAGELIAKLERSGVLRERLRLEFAAKAEKAVKAIEEHGRQMGLDQETLRYIKEQVYGIL